MNEGALHIEERGSGPPGILVHGTPSSPDDFRPLAERLAAHHRVLVPHLPGYGRSPADPAPRSLDDVSARLERRLLDMGVSSAIFIAFSGGAYKAVRIALGTQIHVVSLVLFAPVVGLDPDAAAAFREVARATRSGAFNPRLSWLARMTGVGFSDRDPDGAARVLGWLEAAPLSVICDELEATAEAVDLRPHLGELRCRSLVCAGAADNAVPISWSEDIARRIPGARFESIERAGHAVLLEAPHHVGRMVESFLRGADA